MSWNKEPNGTSRHFGDSRLQIINFKTTQLKMPAACLSGRQAIQAVSEIVFGKYYSFVAETRGLLAMPPHIFNCSCPVRTGCFVALMIWGQSFVRSGLAFHNFSKMVVSDDSPYRRDETFVTFHQEKYIKNVTDFQKFVYKINP